MKYIFLCIIVLVSCKKETRSNTVLSKKPKQINLVNNSKKENLANYVKNIEVVQLKGAIKLIGIDKVVFYNDSYFVLDKKTSSLLVYDINGNFMRKIGERGNGPGEYKKIKDFQIDKKRQQVLILSELNKTLYKYSLEGEFKNRILLKFFVHGFILDENDTYTFMSGRSSTTFHTLTNTSLEGKKLGLNFPFPKNTPKISPDYTGGIHKQGKSNYFTEATSSLIYEIKEDITPLYQFNFGDGTWEEKDRYDLNRFMKKNRKMELSYLYNFYCDTDNILAFNFANKNYLRKGYYFKNSDKVLAVPFNLEDSFLYRFLGIPLGIKGNHFISSLNYSSYERMMRSKRKIKFKESYHKLYTNIYNDLKNFSENDNPCLLIYEIKEDS